jgi:hypothetical protein
MNPICSSKSYKLFTKEEDNSIKHLYEDLGIKDWKQIALHLPNRSAKSCQDRFINYLQSNLKAENWTKEEEDHLLNLAGKYGNKWKIISRHLPGRSPISIKNRFVKCLSKNADKEINLSNVNKSRTARLVLSPDFDEKKNLEFPIHKEFEILFGEVFQNEFNAFDFAFNGF